MELSPEDLERLNELGFRQDEFSARDRKGIWRLRNICGWCFFFNPTVSACGVYESRPLGCMVYPIILSDDGIEIDRLCPMWHTISTDEFREKGAILKDLVKMIYGEHEHR